MRKELICLATNDKLYVVRTKTPVYDTSNIKNVDTVEDIVDELSNQNIRHSICSFDGDGKICNFHISQSFGGLTNERKIYIINKLDRGCKIIFGDRFVLNNYNKENVLTSDDYESTEFSIYCKSNYFKLLELSTIFVRKEKELTYTQVENIKIPKKQKECIA